MRKNNYIWLVGHFVRKVIHLQIYKDFWAPKYVDIPTLIHNDLRDDAIKRMDAEIMRFLDNMQQKTFLDYINERVMKWKMNRLYLNIK